jgi:hypothetical protein
VRLVLKAKGICGTWKKVLKGYRLKNSNKNKALLRIVVPFHSPYTQGSVLKNIILNREKVRQGALEDKHKSLGALEDTKTKGTEGGLPKKWFLWIQ